MENREYSYTIFDDSRLVAIHVTINSNGEITHKAEPRFKYEERLRKLYAQPRVTKRVELESALIPGFPNDYRYLR